MSSPISTTAESTDAKSVMLQLRDSTAELHARAEGHAFQRALVSGGVAKAAYIAYLQQMLLVHRALESALRTAAAAVPAIGRVVTPEQYQEPYLLEDLAHFQADAASIAATAGTKHLIDQIKRNAANEPASLLGFHYVLEGANNGNKFIARAVRQALTLTGSAGTRYLDPYADRQREVWQGFKTAMDLEQFSASQVSAILASAKAMFEGITDISENVSNA